MDPNQVLECKKADSPETALLPTDMALSSDFTASVLKTDLLSLEEQIECILQRANAAGRDSEQLRDRWDGRR